MTDQPELGPKLDPSKCNMAVTSSEDRTERSRANFACFSFKNAVKHKFPDLDATIEPKGARIKVQFNTDPTSQQSIMLPKTYDGVEIDYQYAPPIRP